MTEPKPVDEIMSMVSGYRHSLQYESQRIQDFTFKCILEAITAIVAERDQANTIAGDAHAEIERLTARVVELEKAVMAHWQQDPEGNLRYSYCAFCLMGPSVPHEPDCIVRTIVGKDTI